MKKIISVFLVLGLMVPAFADTREEIKNLIVQDLAYLQKNLKGPPEQLSSKGSLEFWSSGGLLVDNRSTEERFETFTGTAKHIEVVVLVEGEAAVAQFYQEAVMKPVNSGLVSNYRARVTQVFVKESGRWKIAAAHYSPLVGGAGTSQVVVE